jgi:hypothetical protein
VENVDGDRIILKWIWERYVRRVRTAFFLFRTGHTWTPVNMAIKYEVDSREEF